MKKKHKLILIGDSAFAEVAFEYFDEDSPYEVVGFTVEREYLRRNRLFRLPVVPFEDLESHFSPEEHYFFAALVYTQMNQLRTRLYKAAKGKGYRPASYISNQASVWRNCEIGEHCFIFEKNVLQPFVRVGNNVVLWSGNHIGHHSTIHENCFISSQVVVSGLCEIGAGCFFGVNSTVADGVRIGANCLVGAGALILGDVEADQKVIGVWKKPKINRAD